MASKKTAEKAEKATSSPAKPAPKAASTKSAAKPAASAPKPASPKSAAAKPPAKAQPAAKSAPKPAASPKAAAKPSAKKQASPPKASAAKAAPAAAKKTAKPVAKPAPGPKPAQAIEKKAAPAKPAPKASAAKPSAAKSVAAKAEAARKAVRKEAKPAANPVAPTEPPAQEEEFVDTVDDSRAGVTLSGIYGGIVVCNNPGKVPKRSPYKKRELKALHEMLLKERESVRKMIISLGDRTFSSASSRRHGEERGYTLELAENASDNETKDTRFSVLAMQETHMAQAEEALARMNEGLYGICVACGATIGYERLMAKPFAVLCIGCRTNYERLRRIGAGGGSGYYY